MVVVGGCGRAWGWIKLRGFYISPHLMCFITFVFVMHFHNYLCISISPKILKEIFAAPCTDGGTAARVYLYYCRKVLLPVPTDVLRLVYIYTIVGLYCWEAVGKLSGDPRAGAEAGAGAGAHTFPMSGASCTASPSRYPSS